MFKFVSEKQYCNKYKLFDDIKFLRTNHAPDLDCYGILFNTSNGVVYYSGDTSDLKNVEMLISNTTPIDKLYVDTTSISRPNGHVYIGTLEQTIPVNLRAKTYCMHLNCDECMQQAKNLGFNVVEVVNHQEKIYKIA